MVKKEPLQTAIRLAGKLAQEPVIGGKRVIDVDNEPYMIPSEMAWPVLEYMKKLRPESKFELKEVMGGYGLDLIETVAEKTEVSK